MFVTALSWRACLARCLALLGLWLMATSAIAQATGDLRVGSKRFTESYILAEIVAQAARQGGHPAKVSQGLGNTAIVYEALRNGSYYPWDYQPLQKASERYMRNHMNLDNLEESKRYPRGE